jgi:hypothetical protein
MSRWVVAAGILWVLVLFGVLLPLAVAYGQP